MTQIQQGKHCASCNKVVVDFTGMNNAEIMTILLKNKDKKACGNFYNAQIEEPIFYSTFKKKANWPAIAAMLVAGIFAVSANQLQAQIRVKGNAVVVDNSGKDKEKYTEPGNDSLITYTLKISSKFDKDPIVGVTVAIKEIGTFTTNKDGIITFNIDESRIPEILQIDLNAYGFKKESISIKKAKIINAKKIELWLEKKEEYMLKGDVSIEETH